MSPIESMVAIPIDTIVTILPFEISPDVTELIWFARICKSGSAIDMKKPSNKPATATIQILFDFVIADPIVLPIGVIPLSTPIKKIVSPITINAAPMRNRTSKGVGIGVRVEFNIKTITVIGRTEYKTSLNFSVIIFKCSFLLSVRHNNGY